MSWPLEAASGSSPREATESAVVSEEESEWLWELSLVVWSCCCLAAAKARRVWRKEETATRARAGGNHSRVWSRMSDPLAG